MSAGIANAFTCTGAYAILIMTGLKRVENRSAVPHPSSGRCAVSVSKSFRRGEYENLMAWLQGRLPDALCAAMPAWDDVKQWPGHIVGTIGYCLKDVESCTEDELLQRRIWNEGYLCWWHLSAPHVFVQPVPCRGNVGMWRMDPGLAETVSRLEHGDSPPRNGDSPPRNGDSPRGMGTDPKARVRGLPPL